MLLIGVGLIWWKWPVAELYPRIVWPLGSSLAAPHGKLFSGSGFVAAVPWVLLSSRVTHAVLHIVADVFGCVTDLVGVASEGDSGAASSEPSAVPQTRTQTKTNLHDDC